MGNLDNGSLLCIALPFIELANIMRYISHAITQCLHVSVYAPIDYKYFICHGVSCDGCRLFSWLFFLQNRIEYGP